MFKICMVKNTLFLHSPFIGVVIRHILEILDTMFHEKRRDAVDACSIWILLWQLQLNPSQFSHPSQMCLRSLTINCSTIRFRVTSTRIIASAASAPVNELILSVDNYHFVPSIECFFFWMLLICPHICNLNFPCSAGQANLFCIRV